MSIATGQNITYGDLKAYALDMIKKREDPFNNECINNWYKKFLEEVNKK